MTFYSWFFVQIASNKKKIKERKGADAMLCKTNQPGVNTMNELLIVLNILLVIALTLAAWS
jgi:hypothetical protein